MSAGLLHESNPHYEYHMEEDSDYYSESDSEYDLLAQRHWEASIEQITELVRFVIFPLLGKFLGRKSAHIMWRRFANWWF
ncbi:hypothetical protein METBIDRAFT_32626 [Metschnikowia bicuspidata var. bicuspidata NRRL YB-4993]|uniref:Uncharacterized protein n=1 Tax=Metschnikowia bicuspidata var. bicuspidata NRRL YB-4993 TaxID=869754 RepID=A0A1A0H9U8_9ASCO|nr:hypothetical protein METBIDRAFT_32626 [Metschnikowia bicuspidata var. bicuspidata NRRL YB-4993]OBA20657.1 hypothetical protein METBIDRAFT_32626 [Metschnikowia bicuspidata var. bicuspidata NRRL YB-4993]